MNNRRLLHKVLIFGFLGAMIFGLTVAALNLAFPSDIKRHDCGTTTISFDTHLWTVEPPCTFRLKTQSGVTVRIDTPKLNSSKEFAERHASDARWVKGFRHEGRAFFFRKEEQGVSFISWGDEKEISGKVTGFDFEWTDESDRLNDDVTLMIASLKVNR